MKTVIRASDWPRCPAAGDRRSRERLTGATSLGGWGGKRGATRRASSSPSGKRRPCRGGRAGEGGRGRSLPRTHRALCEGRVVRVADQDAGLLEAGCGRLGRGRGGSLRRRGTQAAADGRLPRALAGCRGYLDVVVEDDAELQDREQDQEQHGKDDGELDDRLPVFLGALLEHGSSLGGDGTEHLVCERRAPGLDRETGNPPELRKLHGANHAIKDARDLVAQEAEGD